MDGSEKLTRQIIPFFKNERRVRGWIEVAVIINVVVAVVVILLSFFLWSFLVKILGCCFIMKKWNEK